MAIVYDITKLTIKEKNKAIYDGKTMADILKMNPDDDNNEYIKTYFTSTKDNIMKKITNVYKNFQMIVLDIN